MRLGFFLLVSVLVFSGFVIGQGFDDVVSDSIVEDFENGADIVKVVLKMNGRMSAMVMSVGDNSRDVAPRYITREISLEELEVLRFDSNVDKIFSENHLRAFLGESTGVVESDLTNNLDVGGINLTGTAQTVCVIDTGVNFSHPDLLGKNASCIVDCFNKACVENCSLGDDNGHGTHVSGIVAASGGITGVAPNVSLIGVKILDSAGDGSGNDNDLSNAIDWCVANSADVITMSLGTVAAFDSACDGDIPAWGSSIDAAVAQNITVLAASGNDANYTHISAPACMANAIAVGNTYDDNVGGKNWGNCIDATTALDQIVCHANRNSLVKLFAPGAMINSTSSSAGYEEMGGTSMSTPMIAGAVALINQYLSLSGQSKTPSEIEDVLNDTGVVLDDSANSGVNFSRINVYSAILSLDVDAPNVTLVSPVDNHVNLSVNQTFVCNATDWQLANVTFNIWNSSGLYSNETKNLTGIANETSFNLTDMPFGNYEWNCLVVDNLGNSASASANYTLIVGGVEVTLVSPSNNTYTNVNDTNFMCNSSSDSNYELSNVTFSLWNSSSLVHNLTSDVSGFSNSTLFNFTFVEEGNYSWNCLGVNNGSNESSAVNNFTITYDVTSPVISSLDSSVSSSGATVTWTTDEVANSSIVVSGGSWSNSSNNVTSHSIVISGLSASTAYTYNVTSCDRAGNCNSSDASFTTSAAASSPSGGSSSSTSSAAAGAPAAPVVYDVSVNEISSGYTQSLKKGEKINFSIFDFNGGRHLLTVDDVGVDYVNLTIESNPVSLTLGIGQSVRLNLSSSNYYDLLIKLNNITNGLAELTIQLINEPIETVVIVERKVVEEKIVDGKDYFWVVIVLVVVLAAIVFVVVMRRSARDVPSSDKDSKNLNPKGANRKRLKGKKASNKNGKQNKKAKA